MAAPRNERVEKFPATHWSLVGQQARTTRRNRREALGRLLVQYLQR